jgi:hypothetical protein
MAVTKKRSFERWVIRSLQRRQREEARQRRRFDRDRSLRAWGEWIGLEATRQALLPLTALLVVAATGGWWLGSQQACPAPALRPPISTTLP